MIEQLATELKEALPFVSKVSAIGRQSLPDSDNERYYPSDKNGVFVYVKFAGEEDFSLSAFDIMSRKGSYVAESRLSAFVFAQCSNISDIAASVFDALHFLPTFETEAESLSTDKQAIILAETGEPPRSNTIKAAKIDFSAKWHHVAACRKAEEINCNVC